MLRAGALLAAALLGGCQPEPTPEPTLPPPTPFPEITTSPSFEGWLAASILDYRQTAPNAMPVGFGFQVWPIDVGLQAVAESEYQLAVSSAEPPGDWFVTPLGWEGIAFVVHPENRVRQLDSEQLQGIFRGEVASWDELGGSSMELEPVIPLEGDELRAQLGSALLAGRAFTPAALLGPSPELTLSLVSDHPGAIAVVPLSAVAGPARALIVDGVAPSASTVASGEYPYRVELLATAPAEPSGQIREWLVWLQSGQ